MDLPTDIQHGFFLRPSPVSELAGLNRDGKAIPVPGHGFQVNSFEGISASETGESLLDLRPYGFGLLVAE